MYNIYPVLLCGMKLTMGLGSEVRNICSIVITMACSTGLNCVIIIHNISFIGTCGCTWSILAMNYYQM